MVEKQFPSDIARQLTGTDFRLLDELTFLARQQRKRTGASYAIPGRKYLAVRLGVCIRTVSRSVSRLKRLGILDAIQRRPVRGIWQTNLYKIRSWLGWRLGQISGALRTTPHRETQKARITSVRTELVTPPDASLLEFVRTTPLLQLWAARGKQILPEKRKGS